MCIPVVVKLFVAKRNQLKEVFWAFLRNPACLDRGERCLRETSCGCEQTSSCRTTGGPPTLWQHHQAIHPRWSLPHSTTVSTPALALQGCRRQNAYLATFLVSSESLPLICAPAGYFRSDDKTLKRGGAWGGIGQRAHALAATCGQHDSGAAGVNGVLMHVRHCHAVCWPRYETVENGMGVVGIISVISITMCDVLSIPQIGYSSAPLC